jgi:hypothetical protein
VYMTCLCVDSTDDVKQRIPSKLCAVSRCNKTRGLPPLLQIYIDSSKVAGVVNSVPNSSCSSLLTSRKGKVKTW